MNNPVLMQINNCLDALLANFQVIFHCNYMAIVKVVFKCVRDILHVDKVVVLLGVDIKIIFDHVVDVFDAGNDVDFPRVLTPVI
jgi:hypothetical protein